jgi:lactate racemase
MAPKSSVTSVELMYGGGKLSCVIPSANATVIQPKLVEAISDAQAQILQAFADPIESAPLKSLVRPTDRIVIVIPDITRPFPGPLLLGIILNYTLAHVSPEQVVIISGTGSHRPNTREELKRMVGAELLRRYRVINHDAKDRSTLSPAGKAEDGHEVYFNREYIEADRRIALGYIEPHLMAGFSGGYKAIMPGIADLATIMRYHSAAVIGDPRSTYGVLTDNPTQALIQKWGSLIPLDFLINVTMNREREITGIFCGDPLAAHAAGCEFVRATSMIECARKFPIVVTSNNGYPLDQNLYQTVKGIRAAGNIVEEGGLIIVAAECRDGFPEHGNFRKLMHSYESPEALLAAIHSPGFSMHDQWEAQLLAMTQSQARVALYSELPKEEVRMAFIEPINNIEERIAGELQRIGTDAAIAVLPEGFAAVPYVT